MNCIGGIQGLNGLGPWQLSLNGRRPETPPHIMNTHTYEPHTLCTINTLRVARPAGGRVGCECNPARIQSAAALTKGKRHARRNVLASARTLIGPSLSCSLGGSCPTPPPTLLCRPQSSSGVTLSTATVTPGRASGPPSSSSRRFGGCHAYPCAARVTSSQCTPSA